MTGMEGSECNHTAKFLGNRLTSFLAFLRRLGSLCKAGVQPGSGLAVVAEEERGDRPSGALKTFKTL